MSIKWYLLSLPILMSLLKSYINRLTYQNEFMFWFFDILVYMIFPVSVLYFAYKKFSYSCQNYGLFKKFHYYYKVSNLVTDAVIASCILLFIYFAVYNLAGIFFTDSGSVDSFYSDKLSDLKGISYIFMLLYFSITAAIFEEIFYRGIIFDFFQNFIKWTWLRNWSYVLFSAILFTLAHSAISLAYLISIFMFGFIAALLYIEYKRLEPLIMAHFFTDMVFL